VYGAESAVAFSGGPGGEFNAEDEFLVTYTRLESNWQVEGAFVSEDILRDTDLLIGSGSTSNHVLSKLDLTGYSQTGKYLVVWEECDSRSSWDCNVYGRLYGNWAYDKVYQPLIVR
jgi:hypothetical protein